MSCDISFLINHFFRNFISIFYIRSWTLRNYCLKTKTELLIFLTSSKKKKN